MALTDEIYQRVEPLIETIYHEDFIQGVIQGDLPEQAARRYLRADSKFLNAETEIYALLLSKADDVELKKQLYHLIGELTDERNGAHRVLAEYIGEPYEQIIADDEWYPSLDHYVKHMYYNAYHYANPFFGLSATAACPYVYYRLAELIVQRETLTEDNRLKGWVDYYNEPADEVKQLFDGALDRAGETLSEAEVVIIKRNFYQGAEHERAFFNMATNGERWGFERGDY